VEKMGRSVGIVIDQLLEVIPDDESALRADIINYGQSLWNIAPERLSNGEYYIPLQRILATSVGPIDKQWKKRVQQIFNDEK
jgi:hypothetical protein